MPPLTDPERLGCYRNALANSLVCEGFVNFLPSVLRWLRRELPHLSARDVARDLHDYLATGGIIDEQPETRDEWRDLHEFHHDLRVRIGGRHIYFETRLIYRRPADPDDPIIDVVNIHDV